MINNYNLVDPFASLSFSNLLRKLKKINLYLFKIDQSGIDLYKINSIILLKGAHKVGRSILTQL